LLGHFDGSTNEVRMKQMNSRVAHGGRAD
jgi:hypothetical protein